MPDQPPTKLPQHVGIIMDGNGRWAEQQKKPRIFGHGQATSAVEAAVKTCLELKIEVLTLYAFSTENWQRPKAEIKFLMNMLEKYIVQEQQSLIEKGIQFRTLGDLNPIPKKLQHLLTKFEKDSQKNQKLVLALAINYGSQQEIARAFKKIAAKLLNHELQMAEVDEQLISSQLYTDGLPELDLIIRTSGEQRLSNFLLWQAAYAELYFTKTLWPDFNQQCFMQALDAYAYRDRRKGKLK